MVLVYHVLPSAQRQTRTSRLHFERRSLIILPYTDKRDLLCIERIDMKRSWWFAPALLLPWAICGIDADAQDKKPGNSAKISWKKIVLDKNFRSEGVGVADVNK